MEINLKESEKKAKRIGLIGLGLCALCCALPIIGIIGSVGVLTVLSLYAEKIALVLLIISASVFAIRQYRKRKTPACSIDCACKEEISEKMIDANSK